MKVQDHGNNLIQLTYYGFVNVYLVREEDGFTLVDTALESCARSIVQTAQQFGQPIRRILLTHAHTDHSGGLDAIHALIPEAEFVMPARDARFLTGDMSLDADEPQDKLRGGWVIRKTQPVAAGARGRSCWFASRLLQPQVTHRATARSLTPAMEPYRGRCFSDHGWSGCLRHVHAAFPIGVLATWHKGLALKSARKLRALEPERMAVGHGRLLTEPLAAMDRAIAAAARHLEHQTKKQVSVNRTEREFS